LNQVAQGLSATLDPAQQIAIVGQKLHSALEINHLAIWLIDSATGDLYAAGAWGNAQDGAAPGWRIRPDDASDLVARTFQTGEPVFEAAPDGATQGDRYLPPCAVLGVPLIPQSHATGVIAIQDSDAEPLFDRKQHDFVTSAASQAAIALENARLYAEVRSFNAVLEQRIPELQRERDMLQTLHDIALEVSSTLDLGTLLENSLSALTKLVDVSQGSIML